MVVERQGREERAERPRRRHSQRSRRRKMKNVKSRRQRRRQKRKSKGLQKGQPKKLIPKRLVSLARCGIIYIYIYIIS